MDPVYSAIPVSKELSTSYQPVPPENTPSFEREKKAEVPRPYRHRRSRVLLHWLWHVLSLLWLAPIITLLYLNFSHHIIGASAWCPYGDCNAEGATENAINRARELDRQDHDLTGALQFVAKALEVWFVFIATSLVYDIAILFAKKGRGLPVGYLLAHLEFTDIRYLWNSLLWTSPLPHRHGIPEKRSRIIKLYIFAFSTAFLTILANFMGPSTAVLVLPTLQWIQTPRVMSHIFNGTTLGSQPAGVDGIQGCTSDQLYYRNYTCTAEVYGPSLDQWFAQGAASTQQAAYADYGKSIIGASQEGALQFQINVTSNNEIFWIPSRQILRGMSFEYLKTSGELMNQVIPIPPDQVYNNSLQTILHQQGPSFGVQAGCYAGNATDYYLDDQWIRCFSGWYTDDGNYYSKCYRLGKDVQDLDHYSQFYLQNQESSEDSNDTYPDLSSGIGVYYAAQATYFNDTEDFGSGIERCLEDLDSGCDWDGIFSTSLPEELRNTSINVGMISYDITDAENDDARVYCEHVIHISYPTYSVDTSSRSNPLSLVTMDHLPATAPPEIPLAFHPDWYLAAWSVDHDKALNGSRQVVKELKKVLPTVYEALSMVHDNDGEPLDYGSTDYVKSYLADAMEFEFLHLYALGQALSLAGYNYSSPFDDPASEAVRNPDPNHPIFHTYATIHVWAYSISGRTAKLGVAVVILGSVCVIARLILGIATGVQERSTVEVLAAAFEHRHQGEFEGLDEEGHLAKVRYQIVEDGEGKQRFLPEKRTSRWSHAMSM
ncbi:MAG: hypothetical protein Q9174_004498 [Haloplaca sp. 1 TL-2023]